MAEQYGLLDVFPCCAALRELCGGLQNARLTSVIVDPEARTMTVDAFFARFPAPAEEHMLSERLKAEYGLASVEIHSDFPRSEPAAPAAGGDKGAPAKKQSVLMGKAIKGRPVALETVNLESGNVVVTGKVFAADSREIVKRQAAVLSFCITDGTGSIKVSKYLKDTDVERDLVNKIGDGMYLTVSGAVSFRRSVTARVASWPLPSPYS